jgi:hypothetical protein
MTDEGSLPTEPEKGGKVGAIAACGVTALPGEAQAPTGLGPDGRVSTIAATLSSRLLQMAAEDEYWDNDDLAATHRAIAATLESQRALIIELLEALEALASEVGKLPADREKFGMMLACLCEAKIAIAKARGQ